MHLRLTAGDARWLHELVTAYVDAKLAPYRVQRNAQGHNVRPAQPMPPELRAHLRDVTATFLVPIETYLDGLPRGVWGEP